MGQPESQNFLACIHGQQLSAVTFVQDYLQLQFDGPCLTAYIWPRVKKQSVDFTWNSPGYRDQLCGVIGKKVINTSEKLGQELQIEFTDGVSLLFSLKDNDQVGPEALMLEDPSRKGFVVW